MTSEEWHPHIQISESLASNLIASQFPELVHLHDVTCIGEGWDNKVFKVNERYIFRFPHRDIAAQLIERENIVLSYLHGRLNLDIPNPIFVGQPSEYYPYHFHGYEMIQGQSGCHANLTAAERSHSILKLAEFLKQLHSISESEAQGLGAKPQVSDRTQIEPAIERLTFRVDKLKAKNVIINQSSLQDEFLQANAIQLPSEKVLVHGDLYCRHLLFNKGKLTAIIDWGDTGINNPCVDLSVIYSFYPAECREMFFELYGSVDNNTLAYARFIGLYSAITILLYGYDMQDSLLVQESTNAIKRINMTLLS